MAMNDQVQMLLDNVKQFCEQNIKDIALNIERTRIPDKIFTALREQGFIGANLPSSSGGADLDRASYDAILLQIAEYSPSVAYYVYMNNSVILPLLLKAGKKELAGDIISGKERVGLSAGNILEGVGVKTTFQETAIFPSNFMISAGSDGSIVLLKGTFEESGRKSLGLRGLGIGIKSFSTEKTEEIGRKEDMEKIFVESSWEQAAIFLGLSQGAIEKAVEYTKVRKTFNFPLKDYSPVAFRLSELKSDLEMMKFYLFSEDGDREKGMMLKTRAADFSRKATKYALQYHGGYGYLEDFGVEKFYRDSVALNAVMFRTDVDRRILAESIYKSKTGYI